MQVNNNVKPINPSQFVGRVENRERPPLANPVLHNEAPDFRSIMEKVAREKELQFSKHANMRLSSRNIQLTGEQMQRIEDGITRAQDKGIRDSLVLIDNIALVVNIANKVVVTALNQQDQIFTNIDGAVIV